MRFPFRASPRASALVAAAAMAGVLPPSAAGAQEPARPALTLRTPPQSARVYARDGSLIAELGPEVRTVVPLRSLPRYVPMAFVAIEDRRFFEHRGVDPVGVARALRNTIGGEREGASTITQQLIGAMFPEQVDRREITADRKLREMRMALELEQRYGKERILEAYLNQIYFGHGWYGIEAAARHYFGKGAAQLAVEEAAMLAAVINGPAVYSPKINPARALQRRNLVLSAMAREGVITPAQAAAARAVPIRLAANHGYSTRPQWVIEQVRQFLEQRYGEAYGTRGLRVWTTIDPAAQNAADSALVHGLARVEREPGFRGPVRGTPAARPTARGTPYLQGALVAVDARHGGILAMVGGRSWEDSRFNRVTAARRQPGSAFKPLLYAAALERGLTAATLLHDTALSIALAGSPPYQPRNSDGLFRGPLSLRDGLVESVNTLAVQLAGELGWGSLPALGQRFGLTTPVQPYPSSAIGASAVHPLELAAAYTAFATYGMRMEPYLVRRVADSGGRVLYDARARGVRAISPAVAFITTDLLRDAAERGTGRGARSRIPARVPMAGKTGTTNDAADVWYVGFTPEMVTAVWVGFDLPRPLGESAYGGTVAAPIWAEMMRATYAGRPAPRAWTLPQGAVGVAADAATGQPITGVCPAAAARVEYFVVGTEPPGACRVENGRVVPPPPLEPQPGDTLAVPPPPPDTAAGER